MPEPRYSITYKPSAAKALRKFDRQYQRTIITAIDALARQPRPDGVKKLQGGEGEYRLRVGSYRVRDRTDRGHGRRAGRVSQRWVVHAWRMSRRMMLIAFARAINASTTRTRRSAQINSFLKPEMLPIYLRLGMSPVVLTVVAGLINGTMNIVPWGGPTVRAAAALGVDPSDIFVPMLPSLAVGVIVVFTFAWFLGLAERKRLGGTVDATCFGGDDDGAGGTGGSDPRGGRGKRGNSDDVTPGGGVLLDDREDAKAVDLPHVSLNDDTESSMTDTMLDPHRATLRPKLIWFNLALTITMMVLLVANIFPLAYVFMVGSGIALAVNFPKVKDQATEMVAHSSSIVGVVSMVLAAAVLVGVFNGTGMVDAMAAWVTQIIPQSMGPYMPVVTGLLSIPMTFFMSNDAFYFGILPVLSESAAHFGIEPVEMARTSITDQPVHMQSPLVPAILLLVSLAHVNLDDHHKKVLWRAAIVSIAMLAVAVLIGVIPLSA